MIHIPSALQRLAPLFVLPLLAVLCGSDVAPPGALARGPASRPHVRGPAAASETRVVQYDVWGFENYETVALGGTPRARTRERAA